VEGRYGLGCQKGGVNGPDARKKDPLNLAQGSGGGAKISFIKNIIVINSQGGREGGDGTKEIGLRMEPVSGKG